MTRTASGRAARSSPPHDRVILYEEITAKIIAELEAGRLPCVQPWASHAVTAALGLPKNAATRRNYSGINVLILWAAVINDCSVAYAQRVQSAFHRILARENSCTEQRCNWPI